LVGSAWRTDLEGVRSRSSSAGGERVLQRHDGELSAAERARFGTRLILLGAVGTAVCALTVVLSLTGSAPSDERPFAAFGHALTVAIPIAVGLYAWQRQPRSRFGPLLIAAGFGWSLTTLAESDTSFFYSVGRVSLWFVEPMVLYLILAFPSGRLTSRVDRALVATTIAIVAILFVPTAFLVDSYPRLSPLSGCDEACPANFFQLTDSTPAFVEPVRAVREVLISLVFLAVAATLFQRIRGATRLTRRTITPVLAAAIARLGMYVLFLVVRRIAPASPVTDVVGWILLATLPGIALGFLVGLLRWRLHVAHALEQLSQSILARPTPANLRAAMSRALEDSSLEVAYWAPGDPGHWVSLDGAAVELDAGPNRSVTRISSNGEPAVALVHDSALSEQHGFLDAAASVALFATENHRLTARLQSSLDALEGSRTRIVAAADRERRRIERDLHDGAQQRLVALRIKLELADDLMDSELGHAHELVHEVESEIEEALEDVRSLARGIYPSLLADQGLKEALRAVSLRAPLPTKVECSGVTRYPAEVESAVYFTCLEALQNAAKHARGATAVRISIRSNGELRFEVRDDGEGFDTSNGHPGQGLSNMRDRLAAVKGTLTVRSIPGHGTVVSGTVPKAQFDEQSKPSKAGEKTGEAGIPGHSPAHSLVLRTVAGDHQAEI
jgi:signal transduction histidine kinase